MRDISTPTKKIVLDQLADEIKAIVDATQADAIIRFSQQFYRVSPVSELQNTGVKRLCATVVSYWQKLHLFVKSKPRVEVFNPNFAEQGWHSNHTVIQVHNLDMPFLVDSVRIELARQEVAIHSINNCVINVERQDDGTLIDLAEPSEKTQAESVLHIEVDRHSDPEELKSIREALQSVLNDITAVVTDYSAMLTRVKQVKEEVGEAKRVVTDPSLQAELTEVGSFLDWLAADNFVFLGYRSLSFEQSKTVITPQLVVNSSLGFLRLPAYVEALDPSVVDSQKPVLFGKDRQRSRVHRSAYRDLVVIRQYDLQGQVVGEHHFFGLYTTEVYRASTASLPVIRQKVETVLMRSGFEYGGHSYKQLLHIINEMPRDELLLASEEDLELTVMGIFNLQTRRKPSLFIRQSPDLRYYSCIYYVPRDLYNTALRQKVQNILMAGFSAYDVEFSVKLSESPLSRTHFVLYVDPNDKDALDLAGIEARVMEISRSWDDDLQENLVESFGEEQGNHYANLYRHAFPSSYQEHFASGSAVCDIQQIQGLAGSNNLLMSFYHPLNGTERELRFKIYSANDHVVLSDVIPILENLGMRVLGEHPYLIQLRDGRKFWISDFKVSIGPLEEGALQKVKPLLQQAFSHIWQGNAENDNFNHLVIGAGIGWREVALLRAYARYMKQLRFGFSQPFIAETLCRHLPITRQLATFFRARFEPSRADETGRTALMERIEKRAIDALDEVESLDDDRILRRFLVLIKATLRTNYYQLDDQGNAKNYFSFKLNPHEIPDIQLPRPRFEVFVYSPQVEGVHLRSGPVARGGLRWSDRMEDYRTEVLGLVKAQQVKNSVIVPMGAKGCFITKQPPIDGSREAYQAEGIACYRIYIRGLLDITDNLLAGDVVPPPNVVRHDDDDTYLVVAADKGTATFSDIANEISADYNFWLGDAFASGGSEGYDHKKMGITARGAWESVKRHFRERGIDTQSQEFSVIGIGDMSGDVFGNGMLLSEHIQLVAAFNHQHIFIDPTPNIPAAYIERQRLFSLPRSSWEDYDTRLISEGGGIFSRSLKWVPISAQMKKTFAIKEDRLAPSDLISALLKAPVDMLWNGGIGTYVKASDESHVEVGDKTNDGLRINGNELRCKVLGEGGNLGFTQRGRIEFAMGGGASNTDFIDNAGGVDCSDHEVNIKILLNELIQQGDLTFKQRNQLLRDMTEEVGQLVLNNNYHQALALNIAETGATKSVDDYIRLIKRLEKEEKIDRSLEFLSSDKELLKRKAEGRGLTRPELSVLISYVKIDLKKELVHSWIPSTPEYSIEMRSAFPQTLLATFPNAVDDHRLYAEITATQIANELVNRMGITYVDNIRSATGADYAQIAAAYLIVRHIYMIDTHWQEIEALDGRVDTVVQVEMMKDLIGLTKRATHWLLRHRRDDLDLNHCVDEFQAGLQGISSSVDALTRAIPYDRWQKRHQYYSEQGVPELLSAYCSAAESQYWLLDIIEVAGQFDRPVEQIASVYFQLGEELNLIWLDQQIRGLKSLNHWQALAAVSYRNELDHQLRELTSSVFKLSTDEDREDFSAQNLLQYWGDKKSALLARWQQTLIDIQESKVVDCAVFSVALSVLLELT